VVTAAVAVVLFALSGRYGYFRANFLVLQVLLLSLGATYLWILGLVHPWRDPAWATYRVLAWTRLAAGTYPMLIAADVAAAYHSVPADRRGDASIYATNYGEAGAIDRFGPARRLPPAWGGHNGYGLWGPPPQSLDPVVVVWEDQTPDAFFVGCKEFACVTAPVPNEESDRASVYVCTAPVGGWHAAWPRLVHLSSDAPRGCEQLSAATDLRPEVVRDVEVVGGTPELGGLPVPDVPDMRSRIVHRGVTAMADLAHQGHDVVVRGQHVVDLQSEAATAPLL
jgi:hypothetical protein